MNNPVDGSGSTDGSDAGSDAAIPPGWDMLVSRSWSLPFAGDEEFKCVRIQVQQDMWISGFKPVAPTGTHHSLLTLDPVTTQTGEFDCNSATGFDPVSDRLLYASGYDTNELVFPQGVAVHIPAGSYITLNLHLLASGDFGIHGTSGVLVQTVDPSQVVHEIDATLAAGLNKVLSQSKDFPEFCRVYGKPDGTPWKTGDRLIQSDLADTLSVLAVDGPDAFYKGVIARKIALF